MELLIVINTQPLKTTIRPTILSRFHMRHCTKVKPVSWHAPPRYQWGSKRPLFQHIGLASLFKQDILLFVSSIAQITNYADRPPCNQKEQRLLCYHPRTVVTDPSLVWGPWFIHPNTRSAPRVTPEWCTSQKQQEPRRSLWPQWPHRG